MVHREDMRSLDAAERALGTERLPPGSRAEIAAMREWEETLAPLADAIPPVAPPKELYDRVLRIITEDEGERRIAQAERATRGAHLLAGTGLVVAALAILALVFDAKDILRPNSNDDSSRSVAVMTPVEARSGFIARLDDAVLVIQPLGVVVPEDRTLYLWALADEAAPRLLGEIASTGETRLSVEGQPDLVLAVSAEPRSDVSPAQPTATFLFKGALVAMD